MILFNNIYKEFYIILIILSIIFYYISKINQNKLLALIVIILIIYYVYIYLNDISIKKEDDIEKNEISIIKDVIGRKEISNENYYIKKFPKNIKYLINDDNLMNIITNIRFVRKFDNAKYTDIILLMDTFMKIYIYILSDRYDAEVYIPIFMDIRYSILEILYSLIIVVPDKLKHIYGLDTYKEINKSIEEFLKYSRNMLTILENYGKIGKGIKYIQDNKYRPYNILESHKMP